MSNPSSSKHRIRPVAPKLFELIEGAVYGDVWERPELNKRDRSLITVAALVGMRQTDQLRSHLEKALANGVTQDEFGEIFTHLAVYAGFPAAISAALVARGLFEDRGLIAPEQAQ
ncbi:carboxymuconolactone decarboxylase family protein [Novosphingobium album (ex Liu et al. 2023)]|uniref:Carboxymuconolactone decarboxylase family protein n=1 Tax=Novosphingobium album (ex Liu et al. 2023) TaxID=3031130 RepID=A0ABT5WQV7_9SPHN|nr:carboxymuconolactone decarboxylase family protein [Novosphingobium album (ex Liu et al. 2023)]MDE8652431.1 carboxymuconolactone decarboxylase family protein [Novosphingobium album (ex Liu et al. 2023)]